MIVRELIKELLEFDLDTEIKITILPGGMPDNLTYSSKINYLDYNEEDDRYEIVLLSDDFVNSNKDGTLIDLLKQCKLTGYGVEEFPEALKQYEEMKERRKEKNDGRSSI